MTKVAFDAGKPYGFPSLNRIQLVSLRRELTHRLRGELRRNRRAHEMAAQLVIAPQP
jgi:hypothetical protein